MVLDCTPRQWEVLVELCRDGCDDRTIGHRLFISLDTVKSHMKILREKAHVSTRAELAVQVLRGEIEVTVKGRPVRKP